MDFQKIFEHDIFVHSMGVKIEGICDDCARMSLKIEKKHLNAGNTGHGGAIFTLADFAMAAMANRGEVAALSIQSDIRYLTAVFEGDTIIAEAREVYTRKKMSHHRVEVRKQNGELVAIAEGMFHLKHDIKGITQL